MPMLFPAIRQLLAGPRGNALSLGIVGQMSPQWLSQPGNDHGRAVARDFIQQIIGFRLDLRDGHRQRFARHQGSPWSVRAPSPRRPRAPEPRASSGSCGAGERFRIDVFKPDERGGAARARGLLDEAGNAVAERVDLQDETDREAVHLAQLDHAVEDRLPVLVAREIIVRDEEAPDALREIGADDPPRRRAVRKRDLRPCTLMMTQKLHWNGQPRPASKLV
jgi:hypothetical protein